MKNTLHLMLRLTSPMHVDYPGGAYKELNDGKPELVSKTVTKDVHHNGGRQRVPYFPANGLRGALRRRAAARIMAHLSEHEQRVPADLYLGLNCGASSGSPDTSSLSMEEVIRAAGHVYMGLFGGGARLLPSRYKVSDINPIIDYTYQAGLVPSYLCREVVKAKPAKPDAPTTEAAKFMAPWELLDHRHIIRVDDVYRVMRRDEMMRFIDSPVESVTKHQEAIRGKDEDDVRRSVALVTKVEGIGEGVLMHFSITLSPDTTDEQIGMLLMALQDVVNENCLGGWGRAGYGRYRVEALHFDRNGVLSDPSYGESDENLDEELISVEGSDLYTHGPGFSYPPSLTSFIEKAEEAIGSLSVTELAEFFIDFSLEKKREERAAKKARDAAKAAAQSAEA